MAILRIAFCFFLLAGRIFSQNFIYERPDFFADSVAGSFCKEQGGKKCPIKYKSSRKIPGKILQNLCNKSPRYISVKGLGQQFSACVLVNGIEIVSYERCLERNHCKRRAAWWRMLPFGSCLAMTSQIRGWCQTRIWIERKIRAWNALPTKGQPRGEN